MDYWDIFNSVNLRIVYRNEGSCCGSGTITLEISESVTKSALTVKRKEPIKKIEMQAYYNLEGA